MAKQTGAKNLRCPPTLMVRMLKHLDDIGAFVLRNIGMPNIDQKDDATFIRVIPHFVVKGIIQHKRFAFCPTLHDRANPHSAQRSRSAGAAALDYRCCGGFGGHEQRQVNTQPKVGRRRVRSDARVCVQRRKETVPEWYTLEQRTVLSQLLQHIRRLDKVFQERPLQLALEHVGVPIPLTLLPVL